MFRGDYRCLEVVIECLQLLIMFLMLWYTGLWFIECLKVFKVHLEVLRGDYIVFRGGYRVFRGG